MLTNEQKKVIKIIIMVCTFIALAIGVEYIIEYFMEGSGHQISFFANINWNYCLFITIYNKK